MIERKEHVLYDSGSNPSFDRLIFLSNLYQFPALFQKLVKLLKNSCQQSWLQVSQPWVKIPKMSFKSVKISCFEAYEAYKKLNLRNKNTKLETVTEILNEFHVIVQPKPLNDQDKIWLNESKKIILAWSRILENNRKRKAPGENTFFDSTQYTTLTKVILPKNDQSVDSDFDSSDLSDGIPTPKKTGRPKISINLDSKTNHDFRLKSKYLREQILSFCEKENLNVGTCLAKIASMILNDTTGKHYDFKSGQVFSKIAKGQDLQKCANLDAGDGVYLMQSLEIGRNRMIDLKQFLEGRNVHIPNTDIIKRKRMEIVPTPDDCFSRGKYDFFFLC